MDNNYQVTEYNNNPIKKWIVKIWNKIKDRFKQKETLDSAVLHDIKMFFPDETKQEYAKNLAQDLVSRNNNLFSTLDIRMLDKNMVDLFGKTNFERVVTDPQLQTNLLKLYPEELKTYSFLLNYKSVSFKDRIPNLPVIDDLKNFNYDELQSLDDKEQLKAVSIILSDSAFKLNSIAELKEYYEERKQLCRQIIEDPEIIDKEYQKRDKFELSSFPTSLIYEMNELSNIDRIKYAIIEAKYGMSLEKAKYLCNAFGQDIDKIEQSEDTRVIKELKYILQNKDIDSLRKISLDENYANYEGTINIIANLKNAYLHKYQETLYQINEEDYIGMQSIWTKKKDANIRIYNALGKNNDRAEFNMILTALGGIYPYGHDYNDYKADWDRADENHSISCSYIGNDFLGVVWEDCLLAFSDVKDNELILARNGDVAGIDYPFYNWNDLYGNKFLTPQDQINYSKGYNELLIERKVEKEGKLVNRTPTFAVFLAENIDDINDDKNDRWNDTKQMAAELGIPIVVIDGTQCTKLEFQKIQDMLAEVKENKRMDLIPEIVHKIENNRGARGVLLKEVRDEIFSKAAIRQVLEDIMNTIISSDIDDFNKGVEEFTKVTREIQRNYSELKKSDKRELKKYKTYSYTAYLDRLKTLFITRNGLNSNGSNQVKESEQKQGNSLENNDRGISL